MRGPLKRTSSGGSETNPFYGPIQNVLHKAVKVYSICVSSVSEAVRSFGRNMVQHLTQTDGVLDAKREVAFDLQADIAMQGSGSAWQRETTRTN